MKWQWKGVYKRVNLHWQLRYYLQWFINTHKRLYWRSIELKWGQWTRINKIVCAEFAKIARINSLMHHGSWISITCRFCYRWIIHLHTRTLHWLMNLLNICAHWVMGSWQDVRFKIYIRQRCIAFLNLLSNTSIWPTPISDYILDWRTRQVAYSSNLNFGVWSNLSAP